jgi:hypothetical protein
VGAGGVMLNEIKYDHKKQEGVRLNSRGATTLLRKNIKKKQQLKMNKRRKKGSDNY